MLLRELERNSMPWVDIKYAVLSAMLVCRRRQHTAQPIIAVKQFARLAGQAVTRVCDQPRL